MADQTSPAEGNIPSALGEAQGDPLDIAKPTSLDELFNRDPLSYTDQDITIICQVLRDQRKVWMSLEAKGAKRGVKAKAQDGPKAAAPDKLDLGDLDL